MTRGFVGARKGTFEEDFGGDEECDDGFPEPGGEDDCGVHVQAVLGHDLAVPEEGVLHRTA